MKKNTGTGNIDTVFVLVIFSTFAFSVLMVLALCAGIYKNISDISKESESQRTALSYVRTKLRNLDSAGAFQVAPGNAGIDGNALLINENIGGAQYITAIYTYDGWLREMFYEDGFDFAPEDGMPIAELPDLRFEMSGDGFIEAVSGDMRMLLTPRSAGEAP